MRAVSLVFAIAGGCALVAAVVAELVIGDLASAGWLLAGPGPFYAAGLAGAFRERGHGVAEWLLATGALFMVDVSIGDTVLPLARHFSAGWVVALLGACVANGSVVAGIGLIGLFPTGRPERPGERRVLIAATVIGLLLPVLLLVTSPVAPSGAFPDAADPVLPSPLFVPGTRFLAPAVSAAYYSFWGWIVLGMIMLYLRYRRSPASDRRRIRQLLLGASSAVMVFAALFALAWTGAPGLFATVAIVVLWALGVALVLGSLLVALSWDEMFGIDRSARRRAVHRALLLLLATGYVALAATLGIVASHYLPAGVAILLAVGAALLVQPVQRRLERVADRWAFGARLDGYEVLTRFGAMLESSPGPDDLLAKLAEAICNALWLRWARVRLDLTPSPGARPLTGTAGIMPDELMRPALVVPLIHSAQALGAIEVGDRKDGPLLDEDRRLLAHLAGQAATAVRNLHLTMQLEARLDVIRRQAAELTASRERVVQAQDAERQRIQRDLHDGFQQDIVVLTAKLALARERLRRGDERGDQALGELQRDLGDLLAHLREFAHAIHPPVLADQGLLEAIEAQAARMPVEVVIDADPALRGVRYPRHIESATWYVVAEALTNAVKHARARRVVVALAQPNGCLAVEVNDDGCGFDPAAVRGVGLAGLADRMSIVNGALTIDSGTGRGTTLRAQVPLTAAGAEHE